MDEKVSLWLSSPLSSASTRKKNMGVIVVQLISARFILWISCTTTKKSPNLFYFPVRIGFYDTFANPQRCHIIPGALYRNIISMHSPWAIPREPGERRPLPSKIHGSWAWAWCPEHGPVSDVNQRLMQVECSAAAFILRGSMENRSRGRAHVPSLPYPPLSLHLQNKCEHDSGGRILILKQPQKILPSRRRYSTFRWCWLLPKANCLSLTYRASEMLTH